jgi:hypothetical protein
VCIRHSAQREVALKQNQPGKIPWLLIIEQMDPFAMTMQANQRGSILLNKNATDMGTSVAELLTRKTWLNCSAETRP